MDEAQIQVFKRRNNTNAINILFLKSRLCFEMSLNANNTKRVVVFFNVFFFLSTGNSNNIEAA